MMRIRRISIWRATIARRTLLLMLRPLPVRHLSGIVHRSSRNMLRRERRLHGRTSLLLWRIALLLIWIVVRLLRRELLAGNAKCKPMGNPALLLLLWRLAIVIRLLLLRRHMRHGRRSSVVIPRLLELLTSLVQERHASRRGTVKVRHLCFNLLLSCSLRRDLRCGHSSRMVVIVYVSHSISRIRLLRLLKTLRWRLLLLLLCPRSRRLGGSAIILLVLRRCVPISSRRTRSALSMPMMTSLSRTRSRRHACRAERLVIHVPRRSTLLLNLPSIDGLHMRCTLRWLPPVRLSLSRLLLRRSLRGPILRMSLLHRTSVGRCAPVILRLWSFLRRRLGLRLLLNRIKAKRLVIKTRSWNTVLSCRV